MEYGSFVIERRTDLVCLAAMWHFLGLGVANEAGGHNPRIPGS